VKIKSNTQTYNQTSQSIHTLNCDWLSYRNKIKHSKLNKLHPCAQEQTMKLQDGAVVHNIMKTEKSVKIILDNLELTEAGKSVLHKGFTFVSVKPRVDKFITSGV